MDDELRKLDEIRRRTGVSLAEAKAALDQAAGDLVRALVALEATHPQTVRTPGSAYATGGGIDFGDGRIASAAAHGGVFIGMPILVPLLLYFLSGQHAYVRHHAFQALIWQVAATVVSIALMITMIGAPLILVVVVIGLWFTVVAIVRALQGEYYRYPFVGGMADRL